MKRYQEINVGDKETLSHVITKEDIGTEQFEAVLQLVVNDVIREAMEDYDQTGNNDSKESYT